MPRPRLTPTGRQEPAEHAVPADDHAAVPAGTDHSLPAPSLRRVAQLQHAIVPLAGVHGAVLLPAAPGAGLRTRLHPVAARRRAVRAAGAGVALRIRGRAV